MFEELGDQNPDRRTAVNCKGAWDRHVPVGRKAARFLSIMTLAKSEPVAQVKYIQGVRLLYQ